MALSEQKARKIFGSNVARIRNSKRLTQEQLAERSNLDRMTIAFVEGGLRFPRLSTIQAIGQALGVNVQDFFKDI